MREGGRRLHFDVAVAVALTLLLSGAALAAAPETPPRITGRSAIVLDATTGAILWQRDSDRQMPPASTTKIMTTLLALESGRLDRSFVVSPLAAEQAPCKLGLHAGQRVQLDDLTYALMLKSANDAAVVVAEGVAGSVPQFAELMNERARQVGATNTHFHNPNGLPDDEHVTTTHDMAMILRHALTVPGFREVAGTSSKVIEVQDTKLRPMVVHSKNRLLQGYFVPVLGKTGYTRAAGRCFAGAGELNGHKIITVVFGASDMWGDTRRLMEYGFSSFDDTAPLVQVAQRQQPRQSERRVASRSTSRRARTAVASRTRRATPQQVASAKAAEAVVRAKANLQATTQARASTAAATAAAKTSASRSATTSRGRSSQQQAKAESTSTRTAR